MPWWISLIIALPVWFIGLILVFYGGIFTNNGLTGRDSKFKKIYTFAAPAERWARVVSLLIGLVVMGFGAWVIIETGVRSEQTMFVAEDGTRLSIPVVTTEVAGIELAALQPEAIRLTREWEELPEEERENTLAKILDTLPPDAHVWMKEPETGEFGEFSWGDLDEATRSLLLEYVDDFAPAGL